LWIRDPVTDENWRAGRGQSLPWFPKILVKSVERSEMPPLGVFDAPGRLRCAQNGETKG